MNNTHNPTRIALVIPTASSNNRRAVANVAIIISRYTNEIITESEK